MTVWAVMRADWRYIWAVYFSRADARDAARRQSHCGRRYVVRRARLIVEPPKRRRG